MEALYVIAFALVATVSAHYQGYPFVHQNQGKYGSAFKVANYGNEAGAPVKAAAAPVVKAAAPSYAAGAPSHPVAVGYGGNNEYNYRGISSYPIHVGNGQFYYLGAFNGDCSKVQKYGFYFTGEATSYVMCDHGKAHRFNCPKGTANRDTSDYQLNRPYSMTDMCSVNLNKH